MIGWESGELFSRRDLIEFGLVEITGLVVLFV